MTIEELITYGQKYVHKTQAQMLLAAMLNVNPLELLLILNHIIDKETCELYKEKIFQIKENYPIQYVIGNVNFYGYLFKVNKNVLIPRFETEELVENVLQYIKEYFLYPISVIDLGCGSGAIGITLKKKINEIDVTLLDISESALEVAKENANNLGVCVNLIHSDMWENVKKKYDVIVSNPPYIKDDEEIEEIVKNNEPTIALYGGVDGLDCYRKIREKLLEHVNERFLLAMEIGDQEKEDVINLFNDIEKVKIIAKKDLTGRDRMIFVMRNLV